MHIKTTLQYSPKTVPFSINCHATKIQMIAHHMDVTKKISISYVIKIKQTFQIPSSKPYRCRPPKKEKKKVKLN